MSRKVLVVDDEKLIVKGIRFSLEQDGMEVDCAYDGEEALEMAKEKKYDIILLDLMLPKMDGFEVCQQIREFSNVPIVMLYQTLKKNEPFADLKELMGEEAFEKFGMQTDTTHISITDSELEQELGEIYDPVCIAVPYSAPNQENAVKWIKSLDSRK